MVLPPTRVSSVPTGMDVIRRRSGGLPNPVALRGGSAVRRDPPVQHYWLLGTSFGLLLPGACAGLPEGNWPGGKFALEGAIRSSNSSTFSSISSIFLSSTFLTSFLRVSKRLL